MHPEGRPCARGPVTSTALCKRTGWTEGGGVAPALRGDALNRFPDPRPQRAPCPGGCLPRTQGVVSPPGPGGQGRMQVCRQLLSTVAVSPGTSHAGTGGRGLPRSSEDVSPGKGTLLLGEGLSFLLLPASRSPSPRCTSHRGEAPGPRGRAEWTRAPCASCPWEGCRPGPPDTSLHCHSWRRGGTGLRHTHAPWSPGSLLAV